MEAVREFLSKYLKFLDFRDKSFVIHRSISIKKREFEKTVEGVLVLKTASGRDEFYISDAKDALRAADNLSCLVGELRKLAAEMEKETAKKD